MAKPSSVISLDPIDRKKRKGILARFFITRWYGGKPIKPMYPYGHYMFCGVQGSGKTASIVWYAERLARRYKRKGYNIDFYSNMGLGEPVQRSTLFDTINNFNENASRTIRIVLIDEIQTYFPRGSLSKEKQAQVDDLTAIFSQLRKRQTFILSTAQIYGRLDKSLREQCLYMVDCRNTSSKTKLINEFIPQEDILCDELGRWSGNPKWIYRHGLGSLSYDTKRIIRE